MSTVEIEGASEIDAPSETGDKYLDQIRPPRPGDALDLYRFQMDRAWESSRDQWDRPKVRTPEGKYTGYRRSSSYGSPLESDFLIARWRLRQVARGVAHSQALRIAITRAERDLDNPDPSMAKAARDELNALVEKALDAVGSSDKAVIGTALHDILELIDWGQDPGFVPEEFRADVEAYKRAVECFEVVSSERIVVQDKWKIGGKYDRVVRTTRPLRTFTGVVLPTGYTMIGDVKTSQSMDFAGPKFGEQCWSYANGVPYDPITEERYGWGPFTGELAQRYGPGHEPPSTDWAVIIHVPSTQGIARLHWVDLKHYEKAITQTDRTYQWRNSLGKRGIQPVQSFEDYALTAAHARSVEELMKAHERALANEAWDEGLKRIFGTRKRELEEAA